MVVSYLRSQVFLLILFVEKFDNIWVPFNENFSFKYQDVDQSKLHIKVFEFSQFSISERTSVVQLLKWSSARSGITVSMLLGGSSQLHY